MKTLKLTLTALLSGAICFTSLNAQVSNSWTDYDRYAEQRMKEWNIPGMAITVVKGDSLIFQNTYGYSNVESKTKVTKNTLFAIGSCTKFFTTTGLSMLADENKIDFNERITKYYPALKLKDSVLQKEIMLKDILAHHTGLERGDHIWFGANYSRQEILDRLKFLEKQAPLRDAFIYNNMMYTLAGTIIENQSGLPYETFIKQRLFVPLKMNNTFFDLALTKSAYSLPYRFADNNYKQLPMPQLKGAEPAGAIWSDIEDMRKWLSFHLRNGKIDTTQLVSKKSIRRLKTPIHFTGNGMREDETEYKSYGLGIGFTAYKGYRVMYHTGVAGGYTAHMAFLPEKNIGIMILTNTDTYTFAMMNNLFDRVLGLEQTDWNTPVIAAVKEQWKEEEKERNDQQLKIKNSPTVKDPGKFKGVFTHPFCKPVEVITKSNKLYLKHNGIEYLLATEKENEFISYDENVFGEMKLLFDCDAKGNVSGLKLNIMGEELDYKKEIQK
ncbi:MAG: beta-lactamase family protein [Bacteroidia bacterium]|nr:beta-lactamase family protein [Bacteroidia bacterium]